MSSPTSLTAPPLAAARAATTTTALSGSLLAGIPGFWVNLARTVLRTASLRVQETDLVIMSPEQCKSVTAYYFKHDGEAKPTCKTWQLFDVSTSPTSANKSADFDVTGIPGAKAVYADKKCHEFVLPQPSGISNWFEKMTFAPVMPWCALVNGIKQLAGKKAISEDPLAPLAELVHAGLAVIVWRFFAKRLVKYAILLIDPDTAGAAAERSLGLALDMTSDEWTTLIGDVRKPTAVTDMCSLKPATKASASEYTFLPSSCGVLEEVPDFAKVKFVHKSQTYDLETALKKRFGADVRVPSPVLSIAQSKTGAEKAHTTMFNLATRALIETANLAHIATAADADDMLADMNTNGSGDDDDDDRDGDGETVAMIDASVGGEDTGDDAGTRMTGETRSIEDMNSGAEDEEEEMAPKKAKSNAIDD